MRETAVYLRDVSRPAKLVPAGTVMSGKRQKPPRKPVVRVNRTIGVLPRAHRSPQQSIGRWVYRPGR